MVLTIKNFSNPVWPWITATAPTNLVWVAGTLKATLTWTSATGESWVVWTEEKLVRKKWSAPQWSMDWTVVTTITTKDTYASTGYEDTGLDSTKTYYYKVFAVYDNGTEMWSSEVSVTPTTPPFTWLCFTAKQANSRIRIEKNGNPTPVNIETSTDGSTWSDYTFDTTINLVNVWDKIYFRNKSTTTTGLSTSSSHYYKFAMWWWINGSWDINSLLNKNWTTTLPNNYCYYKLFENCVPLATPPQLSATTLTDYCYDYMFYNCTNLKNVPELPATTLTMGCYMNMFYGCSALVQLPQLPAKTLAGACYYSMFFLCSKIKLSNTKTWEYQTAYKIPTTWTGTEGSSSSLQYMFQSTWWTFTWTPTINTTYYTSNQVI